jgi:diaminopropionate ammonia-lyase
VIRTWVRDEAVRAHSPLPARDPRPFHERLPGYLASELVAMPELAAVTGVRSVHLKHEVERFGLPAFKMLGASWAVYRLLEQHVGRDLSAEWHQVDDLRSLVAERREVTLTTATDGNHGRAVARVAALLGFRAHVFVPVGTAAARVAAIEAEAAAVTVVPGDYDEAVRVAAATAATNVWVVSDTSWPSYEDVPAWITEGYATLFLECDEQLDSLRARQPSVVLVPVGVGSLAAAAALHYVRPGRPAPRLLAVEPIGADCLAQSLSAGRPVSVPGPHPSSMAGLNCGTPSDIAWPILRDTISGAVVLDDDPVEQAMRLLAREGLVAGETGAASLGALLAVAASADESMRLTLGLGPDADVLLLCTEGATDPANYERVVGATPAEVASRRQRPPATRTGAAGAAADRAG